MEKCIPIIFSSSFLFLNRLVGRILPPALVYADSKTYSGADEDPNFDADDELVFMSRHVGTHRAQQSQFISHVSLLS